MELLLFSEMAPFCSSRNCLMMFWNGRLGIILNMSMQCNRFNISGECNSWLQYHLHCRETEELHCCRLQQLAPRRRSLSTSCTPGHASAGHANSISWPWAWWWWSSTCNCWACQLYQEYDDDRLFWSLHCHRYTLDTYCSRNHLKWPFVIVRVTSSSWKEKTLLMHLRVCSQWRRCQWQQDQVHLTFFNAF